MPQLYKLYFLIFFSAFFASCTTIETLKKTQVKSDEFSIELFNLYKEFAEKEAEKYDWLDSQHFIDKAMNIAYGKKVLPEEIKNWNIAEIHQQELYTKYDILNRLLANNSLYKSHPKQLAEAQYAYDCLVEELEENWQTEDIANCRNLFETSVYLLQTYLHPKHLTTPKPAEPMPISHPVEPVVNKNIPHKAKTEQPQPKHEVTKQENKQVQQTPKRENDKPKDFSYRIFFEFDSANLTKGSKNALKSIAKEIKKSSPMPEEIVLNGYTDKAGYEEYNLALSKKRAEAVKQFLANEGLPKDKISIFAFGESDSTIVSVPGAREPVSRRVEITITD